jgi:hypothetical protein
VTDTFGARAYRFYLQLARPKVPRGVKVMNPYESERVRGYLRAFLDKYFDDAGPRTLVFGINPGRLGAGITGVTFTDPVALADFCGIPNHMKPVREPSSVFVYDFIHAWGGPLPFYSSFFLSALCPLGFTRGDVNLNYYDDPRLARAVTPYIVRSIEKHIAFGGRTDSVIIIGAGTNLRFFETLNAQHKFFSRVLSVEHPRFIQQYRYKSRDQYLLKYREIFAAASHALPNATDATQELKLL